MDENVTDMAISKARRRIGAWAWPAFFLPMLIMGSGFALFQVFPFGDKQILVTDFWQQYYPFFCDYWHKLREGGLAAWSLGSGVGTNYPALVAYYLASPLNPLLGLLPFEYLREGITALLLVKIGCSGLFCAMYLSSAFQRADMSLPLFSTFFALCAFTMGYYWNIMWFDTFALMPLVALGVRSFMTEGRYRLYVVSLGLSMLFNYYIGYFSCLFTVVLFLVFSFTLRLSRKEFISKLLMLGGYSLIGVGMSAVLFLPTIFALGRSYSAANTFPTKLKLYETFPDILGNFAPLTGSTSIIGLPNVYTGMLCIALAAVFVVSGSVKLREKIAYVGVFLFLLVSCNLNVLNYIWHGFHFTNMLPYRFSFLISFTLVIMAYKGYTVLRDMGKYDVLWVIAACGLVVFAAIIGPQIKLSKLASPVIAALYILLLVLYRRKKLKQGLFLGLLFAVGIFELSGNSLVAISGVQVTGRSEYPDQFGAVRQLLNRSEEAPRYSRTETTAWYTVNDPALYGYNGITLFSSVANVSTTNFMEHIGIMGWDAANRYVYAETSPLTNAFLGVNTLFSRDGLFADSVHWEPVDQESGAVLLKNKMPLSLGFMAEEALSSYAPRKEDDIFALQNDLFSKATGIQEPLFTLVNVLRTDHQNLLVTENDLGNYDYALESPDEAAAFKWDYEVPENGQLYSYLKLDTESDINIYLNNEYHYYINGNRPYIFCCGGFQKGNIVSIYSFLTQESRKKGKVDIYTAYLNEQVLARGYEALADEQLRITDMSASGLTGDVTANRDGLLYISVPYEQGWRAFVDGREQEIIPLDGSMVMLRLTWGEHSVTLRYRDQGLLPGAIISMACCAAFIALILIQRNRGHRG